MSEFIVPIPNESWFPSIMERFPSLVDVSWTQSTTCKYGFLSFLATAQALDVTFLPMTWQSARESVGSGATSSIEEALASIHISLAFKRIRSSEKREKSETEIFLMLTNEIIVLRHTSIREHPNISALQGVCWDISPDGKVWPVLVFEKSQFGDLLNFMRLPVGKQLAMRSRIEFCWSVGDALVAMHSNST